MNILVVGCGRLGSKIVNTLFDLGHSVSVVDNNPDSFNQLNPSFDGITIPGVPLNMNILREAGIESCDSVAVVTSDDNLNITVSQIVKEFFYVENVVAKINSPARERAFHDLGLKTICPTNLACGSFISVLTNKSFEKQMHFGVHTIGINLKNIEKKFIGRGLKDVPTKKNEVIIGLVSKKDQIYLNTGKDPDIILSSGDKIISAQITD